MARTVSAEARPGHDVVGSAWNGLPAALYMSILLTLSFSARKNIPAFSTIFCLILLGCVFTMGVSLGIERTGALKTIFRPVSPVKAEPGLILSRAENVIVLLKETGDVRGPRVVSIPGQPLFYQEVPIGPNNTIIKLPAMAFGQDAPWFLRSIGIDISLSAEQIKTRLAENYLYFVVYTFSLILLLSSLRFLLELSMWPLANLFLGALVFRGILALETFLNTREINTLIDSFLNGRFPALLITPLALTAFGILIILYTLLVKIARPRRGEDD